MNKCLLILSVLCLFVLIGCEPKSNDVIEEVICSKEEDEDMFHSNSKYVLTFTNGLISKIRLESSTKGSEELVETYKVYYSDYCEDQKKASLCEYKINGDSIELEIETTDVYSISEGSFNLNSSKEDVISEIEENMYICN